MIIQIKEVAITRNLGMQFSILCVLGQFFYHNTKKGYVHENPVFHAFSLKGGGKKTVLNKQKRTTWY